MKPAKQIYKTYLSVIKNSPKSRMFRSFYVREDNKVFDATKNGHLSCAFFVSAVLKMFDLIANLHGTVKSTIADLEKSGWKKVKTPKIGSVLVWEEQKFDDETHAHIGFYIGRNKAVSNSSEKDYPLQHDWKFNGKRNVKAIYWKNNI